MQSDEDGALDDVDILEGNSLMNITCPKQLIIREIYHSRMFDWVLIED